MLIQTNQDERYLVVVIPGNVLSFKPMVWKAQRGHWKEQLIMADCADSSPSLVLVTGDLVAGRYRVEYMIAEGGIGLVYRAIDEHIQRLVALKIPRREPYVSILKEEAELLLRLKERCVPNVAEVYDHGLDSKVGYYVAMRFYSGLSLDAEMFMRDIECFPPEEVLEVAWQIQSTLDRAHEEGFLHRDLKLSNILRGSDGTVVLSDFSAGLAAPSYASPELAEIAVLGTARELDRRSDLYSFGVVLYKMLTGQVPLPANSLTEAYLNLNVDKRTWPLPSTINPDLPNSVDLVLIKALNRSRSQRYQTAREMVNDLQNAIQGEISTNSIQGLESRWRSASINALMLLLVLGILVFGVLIVNYVLGGILF